MRLLHEAQAVHHHLPPRAVGRLRERRDRQDHHTTPFTATAVAATCRVGDIDHMERR